MADILPFPGNPGAPVQPLAPRPHFGLRGRFIDPSSILTADELAALGCVRAESDREQQLRIKNAARAARDEADRAGVHPDLHRAFAAKIENLAQLARLIAKEAPRGHSRAVRTLLEMSDILETVAAEAEPLDGGAA